MFVLFAAENQVGLENFTIVCLKSGTFKINSVNSHCEIHKIFTISERTWVLKNDEGKYEHFEFKFHLQEKLSKKFGWNTLSDIPNLPAYQQPNVTDGINEDDGQDYFQFIDNDGNLTNHSHYVFYTVFAAFLIGSILACVFQKQIKKCCNCFCRTPTFEGKVSFLRPETFSYQVSKINTDR